MQSMLESVPARSEAAPEHAALLRSRNLHLTTHLASVCPVRSRAIHAAGGGEHGEAGARGITLVAATAPPAAADSSSAACAPS